MGKIKVIHIFWLFTSVIFYGCKGAIEVTNPFREGAQVNKAPVLDSFTCLSTSLTEGDPLNCTASATDPEGGPITYHIAGGNTCTGASINSSTGVIAMTAINPFVPNCDLIVEASDGSNSSNTITVSLTVANTVPTLTIADQVHPEDTILIADATSSEGDYGTYTLDIPGTTVPKCDDEGTLSINSSTGEVSLVAPNWNGVCNVMVSYDDGNGGIVSDEFQLTYTAVNDGPEIAGSCATTGTQGVAYNCTGFVVSDSDGGGAISFSTAPENTCSFTTVNPINGDVSGTPNDDDVPGCVLGVRAYDTLDYSSPVYTETLTFTNVQPTLTIADQSTTDSAGPVEVASDGDVQANEEGYGVYSIDDTGTTGTKCSDNGIVTINSSNGAVTFDMVDGWTGQCNITVVFDDQNAVDNTVSDQFEVDVMDTTGPTVSYVSASDNDGTYYLGQSLTIQLVMSEATYVSGTPSITLDTGFVDREINYVSGHGTKTLEFSYTVQSDDTSTDLDLQSPSLSANGGTLEDVFNNLMTDFSVPISPSANSLAANKNIAISGGYPIATITGEPTQVSPTSITNMTVGGTGVVEYRFKFGNKLGVDCSDSAGYSADTPIGTPIVESVTGIAVGDEVRFCVVGKNGVGAYQPFAVATTVEWMKGEYAIDPISFAGVPNFPNWADTTYDSVGRLYALNTRGEIFRSLDDGSNWDLQCTVTYSSTEKFVISPGSDGKVYLAMDGDIFRVDPASGAPCANLTTTIDEPTFSYFGVPVTIDTNGHIYFFVADGIGQEDVIHKSTDYGDNWSTHATLTNQGWDSSPVVSLTNPLLMFRFAANDPDGSEDGSYRSIDGGLTWTFESTTNQTNDDIQYKTTEPTTFYTSNGYVSSNDGDTMTTVNTSNANDDGRRFSIELSSGAGYFLKESGSDTNLFYTPDYGDSAHSVKYTFTNVPSSNASQAVSARAGKVAVVVGSRLYVSTDAASSFTEIPWIGTKQARLTGITVEDGLTVYGVSSEWNIVKSTDAGESWSLMLAYSPTDDCVNKIPTIRTHLLDSQVVYVNGGNLTSNHQCKDVIASKDGMATFKAGRFSPYQMQAIRVHNMDDPYSSTMATSYITKTFNGGDFWTSQVYHPQYGNQPTIADAYHIPGSSTSYIYGNSSTGVAYTYDETTETRTDITGATGLTTIAGMDGFRDTSGNGVIRFVERTGQIAQSTDNGSTYSAYGTDPALGSCDIRHLASLSRDRDVVAQICNDGNDISFTIDGAATWRTIDLNGTYGIDCQARGLAIQVNKILVACSAYDIIYIKFNPMELINDALDGVISTSEIGNSTPVLNNTIAHEYNSSEYAIIANGSPCNSGVTFSSSIPNTNDPGFATTGLYRICIKLTDASMVESYVTSNLINVDLGAPSGPSIALAGDAADGTLTRWEHKDNNDPIVGAPTGTDFDYASYSVIPTASTCDGTQEFSFVVPTSRLESNYTPITPGSWKVCVKLTDAGGNPPVYAESTSFTYTDSAVYARIDNGPELMNASLTTNATIAGKNVTSYRYAVGEDNILDCEDKSAYGAETPIATPLTEDLTAHKATNAYDSTKLKICVIANDGSANWQPVSEATEYIFFQSFYTGQKIDLGHTDIANYSAAWVDYNNSSIIYSIDHSRSVYKSSNTGSTWTLLCTLQGINQTTLENNQNVYFLQSPGTDGTIYVTASNEVWRIQDTEGGPCFHITSKLPSVRSNSYYRNVGFGTNGSLYLGVDDNIKEEFSIYKSTDYGDSLVQVGKGVKEGTDYSYHVMAVDPNAADTIYLHYDRTSNPENGLYKSTDDGFSWSQLTPGGTNTSAWPQMSLTTAGEYFDYRGRCSDDGGASFFGCGMASYNYYQYIYQNKANEFLRVDLDNPDGFWVANIQIKTTFGTGGYSYLGAIPYSGNSESQVRLSKVGNTITVLMQDEFYLSTDGGNTFNLVPAQRTDFLDVSLVRSGYEGKNLIIETENTGRFRFFFSDDFGDSFSMHSALDDTCPYTSQQYSWGDIDNGEYFYGRQGNCLTDNSKVFDKGEVFGRDRGFIIYMDSLAIDQYDSSKMMYLYREDVGKSNNYMKDVEVKAAPWAYVSPWWTTYRYSFIDPRDENKYFTLHLENGTRPNRFVVADFNTAATVDLLPSTSFTEIAAFSLVPKPGGGDYLFIMDKGGSLDRSEDYGDTYTTIYPGDTYGACTSQSRIMYVDPQDPNNISTRCSSYYHYSFNGGSNFTRFQSGFNSETLGNCGTNSNLIFDKHAVYYDCSSGIYRMSVENYILANDVADHLLDDSETGNSNDLIEDIAPGMYASAEYAVIDDATTCDAGVTFSGTIPQSNDPAFVASGDYRVCVKYNGSSYFETPIIRYFTGAPSFTSIALANDVADSTLTEQEYKDSLEVLVDTLSASNYASASYSVVTNTTTCEDALTYYSYVPRSNLIGFNISPVDATSYKVCVKVSNPNGEDYGGSLPFTFDAESITATLVTSPGIFMKSKTFNSVVTGTGVTAYKVKTGLRNNISCAVSSGYSSETALATPISFDVSSYSAKDELKICLVGKNGAGAWQAYNDATEYIFMRFDYDLKPMEFGSVVYDDFTRVTIPANNASKMAALSQSGMVYVSVNNGVTWNPWCYAEETYYLYYDGRLISSPAADETVYVVNGDTYGTYKVTDKGGAACDKISDYTMGVAPNGDLYTFGDDGAIEGIDRILKSTDQGSSWSTFKSLGSSSDTWGNIHIHRANANYMYYSVGSGIDIINVSTNGGTSFTASTGTIQKRSRLYSDPTNVNNINSNYSSYYSTDGGDNWLQDVDLSPGFTNGFTFAPNGDAFRLVINSGVEIQKNTDLYGVGSWTVLDTLAGETGYLGGYNLPYNDLAANGTNILISLGQQLFLSTDSGSTFNKLSINITKHKVVDIQQSGTSLYALTYSNALLKSNDAGATWTKAGQIKSAPTNNTHYENLEMSPTAGSSIIITGGLGTSTKASNDEFATYTNVASGEASVAFDLYDNNFIISAIGTSWRKSIDAGSIFINNASARSTQFEEEMILNPADDDQLLFLDSNQLYDCSLAGTWTCSTMNPGFTPVSMEYFDVLGTLNIRVTDHRGNIKVSNNFGSSWSDVATGNPLGSPTNFYATKMTSGPNNRDNMMQMNRYDLVLSFDAGTTWTERYEVDASYDDDENFLNCEEMSHIAWYNDGGTDKAFIVCDYEKVFKIEP